MALLQTEHITYLYEGTTDGIRDITFEGDGGDFIAVVGKNGAGKSTLLNMLSGLLIPQEGRIVCSPDLDYHDLGISTQKQSIDWYLNVYDNILLGAVLAGMRRKEAREATDHIAGILDLTELGDRAPDSVSGGQQQRIQVARALVHNPKVAILDEPTAGLDYRYSHGLFEYLQEKCRKEKKLIFISSHDLTMLEDYCNKILYLDQGTQLYFGNMKSFLDSHRLTGEVSIFYSGSLSDRLRESLVGEDLAFDEQSVTLYDAGVDNLNRIISSLLSEVTITGIESRRTGLKEIMLQKGESDNA